MARQGAGDLVHAYAAPWTVKTSYAPYRASIDSHVHSPAFSCAVPRGVLCAALQRLVGAVQDVERGRSSALLTRSQSSRLLFSSSMDREVETMDDLKQQVSELRARVSRWPCRRAVGSQQLTAGSGGGD